MRHLRALAVPPGSASITSCPNVSVVAPPVLTRLTRSQRPHGALCSERVFGVVVIGSVGSTAPPHAMIVRAKAKQRRPIIGHHLKQPAGRAIPLLSRGGEPPCVSARVRPCTRATKYRADINTSHVSL